MKLLFVIRDDAAFLRHRLPIATGALNQGYEVHLIANETGFGSEISQRGFVFHKLSADFSRHKLFVTMKIWMRLVVLFWKLKPNIIHLSSTYFSLVGALAAYFAPRVPTIISFTGLGYAFTREKGFFPTLIKLLRPLIAIIWNTNTVFPLYQNVDDAKLLKTAGLVTKPYAIIPGAGVNTKRFSPSQKIATRSKFVIGCATRLLKDKGLVELIEAMIALYPKNPNVHLKIAGAIDPFNPSSLTETEINRFHDEANISFVGEQLDMVDFWQSCDAAILVSHREGMPKALLEAASCGLPLIASDVPGCKELIHNSKNGFLVKPRDPQEISRAINLLALDNEFALRAGEASRALIFAKGLDEESVASEYTKLLLRLTES